MLSVCLANNSDHVEFVDTYSTRVTMPTRYYSYYRISKYFFHNRLNHSRHTYNLIGLKKKCVVNDKKAYKKDKKYQNICSTKSYTF